MDNSNMESFDTIKNNCVGKEHPVQPHELFNFKDGKCTMTVTQEDGVTWFIDCQLLNNKTMKVTDIRREGVIHTV